MDVKNIQEVFDAFKNLKVLVVGDVMVDAYIYGSSERISTEAPVPIVNVTERELRLGGAANVALNLQALGAEPILCSIIGDDENGKNFINLLHKHNISSRGVIKSDTRLTTIKHRVFAGTRQMLRFDSESIESLNKLEQKTFIDQIASLVEGVDVVIFEDYDKGMLNQDVIHKTIELTDKLNIPSIVDAKRRNFLNYKGATLFKTHFKILKDELKFDLQEPIQEDLDDIVDEFRTAYQHNKVMITLSEYGMYLNSSDDSHMFGAHARRISDIGGAGDAVISTSGLSLALGLPISLIAQLANLAGGLVCEHPGVVPLKKDDLIEAAKVIDMSNL